MTERLRSSQVKLIVGLVLPGVAVKMAVGVL
jgi:hypothetical protein